MKKIKCVLFTIFCICLLWLIATTVSHADTFENYTYQVQTDGTVSITKYNGKEQTVEIPATINGKNVSLIASEAFAKNTNIITVSIPGTVKKIDSGAFVSCSNLENVYLENGIEDIYSYAFEQTNVKTIAIPESVDFLSELAFFKCSNFTEYQVVENNTEYTDIDGVLYSKDGKELVQYPYGRKDTSYKIVDGTEVVGDQAFAQNNTLKTVEFPSSLTTIEEWAFYSTALEEVYIPQNVTKIDTHVFEGCKNLKTVNMQANIRLLELSVFHNNPSLVNVTLPDTLISIRTDAFTGCTSLKTITMPASMLTIDSKVFEATTTVDISKTKMEKLEDGSYDTIERIEVDATKQYDKAFELLDLVNQEREKVGLNPLVMNESLLENAMERAAETSIYFSHTRPNGKSPDSILTINSAAVGENLFKGSDSTEYALQKWMDSPAHKANILLARFTSIGIGCCEIEGSTYWVQIFTDTNSQPASKPDNQEKTYEVIARQYDYKLIVGRTEQTLLEGQTEGNNLMLQKISDGSKSANLRRDQFTCYNSNPEVATVDNYGTVTALKEGTTTIKVVTDNGLEVSYTVTVLHPRISFTQTEIKLDRFTSIDLNDIVQIDPKYSYSFSRIDYTSSDENIAYITYSDTYSLSKLYGLNEGTIQVTATLPNGEKATCKVIVGKGIPFKDVAEEDWFFQVVKYNYENGIITGTTATTFSPNENLSRGMLATILWRMEGAKKANGGKDFPDVKENIWYTEAIKWITSQKIMSGYDNGKFGPSDSITREQLAVTLRNYANYKKKNTNSTTSLSKYKDSTKVSSWAKTAMQWAVGKKIISGKDNGTMLDPKGTATRAEAAAMINNYLVNVK